MDATLIAAPRSTKNKTRKRDPDMHPTKKGNEWHFGMKAHSGVDDPSGRVHTVISTAAHVSDISQTAALLHGQEQRVGADAGEVGVEKRDEVHAKLKTLAHTVTFRIAKRRTPIKAMVEGWKKDVALLNEKLKASVRAQVEPPFHGVKNIFKHTKTRYTGLAKNDAQLNVLLARKSPVQGQRKAVPVRGGTRRKSKEIRQNKGHGNKNTSLNPKI